MDVEIIALLLVAAAAAGWIDAVVGGGGLLMLPTLLLAFPTAPVAAVLGTNKLTAIFGTCSAAITYARGVKTEARVVWPAAGLALLGAGGGAALAGAVSSAALRPIIMVVLLGVAAFVVLRPAMGRVAEPRLRTPIRVLVAVLVVGLGVGCYDGLIGPGTGTFLIIALTSIIGLDFVTASASAKIVNTATNLGAITVFALNGDVMWLIGLGLAVCNIVGAQVGARMALSRGTGFVRGVLLVVVVLLVVRLGIDQFA
ncbi:TSUP family transporter [Thermobifida halotolerans]|uniref:Probable membrane transporter protein n=1 Tax=Thermobifida halotolerans TaxID=483545 RepID=A0A399G3H0_9ACTN|nr:TSUP family transporter [Thermobifida halotolerans]UOE18295.1 TSUP family transporter [Thermobifida halotolerans]